MATAKTTKLMFGQFHLRDVVLTVRFSAESLEDAVEHGREMKLTDVVDLKDAEWIDGNVELTGVFES